MNEERTLCVNEISARSSLLRSYRVGGVAGAGGWGVLHLGERLGEDEEADDYEEEDGGRNDGVGDAAGADKKRRMSVGKSKKKKVALKFFGYTDRAPEISDVHNEIMLMMAMVGVEGVIQIQSFFYDSPLGMMPNKQRALQVSYPVIVMEHLAGGDLLHRINRRNQGDKPVSEVVLSHSFRSLMHAVESIHKKHYIHRDIKLANILLEVDADDSPVKLIDLGSLTQVDRATRLAISNDAHGTPMFMAPETLGPYNREYSTMSDVWQCGCVLYHMLCADQPFQSRADIKAGKYCIERPQLSPAARDLITRILQVEPRKRLTVAQILAHPWLQGDASEEALPSDYAKRMSKLIIRKKLRHLLRPPPVQTTMESASDDAELSITKDKRCPWTGANLHDEARHYFDIIDRDGDGWFDKHDLQVGIISIVNEKQGNHWAEKGDHLQALDTSSSIQFGPAASASTDEIFDAIDTDHSQRIDFSSFRDFYELSLAIH